MVKNLPAMQEMRVRSLGQEDPWVRKIPGSGRSLDQEDPWVRKIPGSGRSLGQEDPWVRKIPGGGHGNPLQYSCLHDSVDREPGGL